MGICLSSEADSDMSKPQSQDANVSRENQTTMVADKLQTLEGEARLQNIFAKPLEMEGDFKAPVYKKTKEDQAVIKKSLAGNFVFANLGDKEEETLVMAFQSFTAEVGTNVITQGDTGDYFYVLAKGNIDIFVDKKKVHSLSGSGSFGELALLYNCPRAATCTAETKCELWRVDQTTFRRILASNQIKSDQEVLAVFKKVEIFKDLTNTQLRKIADTMTEKQYKAGEYIFYKGAKGDVFYVVKEGIVVNTNIEVGQTKYSDVQQKAGSYFGERALITDEPRAANAIAKTDCTLLCMSSDDFVKYLGPLEDMINKSQTKTKLRGIPIIAKCLTQEEIEELVPLLVNEKLKTNTIISRAGISVKPIIYFILSGSVQKETKSLGAGEYFGDEDFDFTSTAKNVKARNSYKAVEDTVCLKLTMHSIQVLVNQRKSGANKTQADTATILDKSINLKTLKKHRILGAGTFGQVWLVTIPKTDKIYALKIQSKRVVLNFDQVEGVIREKNVMIQLESPFIIRMVNAFQDYKFLYMVTEVYMGGELHGVMAKEKTLNHERAAFYSACIFEGLDYMHQRKILYRDLKPENVMFGSDGYCVIIDLGFAKVVANKTYTLCGTPLYIAPEVLLQRGHDKGADLWSFGVLIYELIVGSTPFYEHGIDQATLFKNISRCKYKLPKNLRSDCANLVSQILVRNPSHRIGCLARGAADIRQHPWFVNSIDFDDLANKSVKAPWIPKVKDPMDCSNFGSWGHLKDDFKGEKKLSSTEQKLFVNY